MAALPDLITVADFLTLPEGGEYAYELHYGEIVRVTRPKCRHSKLQLRLMRLLEPRLRLFGEVTMELPYRPVAEFEVRAADVAGVSRSRWDAIDPNDILRGAPELVVEVRSPSNTKAQLRELTALCLANGALEVWVVDADRNAVTVVRDDGVTTFYQSGQEIPLTAFGSSSLAVDEIFAEG